MDESTLAKALDTLEKSWASVDGWLNVWTTLVVIGVAIELLVLVVEYTHEWRDFKRGTIRSPEMPSLMQYGLGFAGVVLVVAGVTGELRLHVRAGEIEVKMREASRQLVALVNARASKLAVDLEHEKQNTTEFQKQATDAALVLQDRIRTQGPRYFLLWGAASRLARQLERFSGQRASLLICGLYRSDRETLETWGALASILGGDTVRGVRGAGWRMVRTDPTWNRCGMSMQGISVMVSSEATAATRQAADALSRALLILPRYNTNPAVIGAAFERGVMSRVPVDPDEPPRFAVEHPDTVVVFIGEHPPQ